MRGIATVDRQPDSDSVAVWITSRISLLEAGNTNAVVVDLINDSHAMDKLRNLVHNCAVVLTDGSVLDGLPVRAKPLTVGDIASLVTETESRQRQILAAVEDYKSRTKSRSIVSPAFPASPAPSDFTPAEDTAAQRALAAANYLVQAWGLWLRTDEERRRRIVQPRTGTSPWIMPGDLGQPTVADFPAGFAERLHREYAP